MLHTVPNEDALAKVLLQMLPNLANARCVVEPALLDAVDLVEAAVDCRLWIDQGVEHDAPLLIHYRNLAHHACKVRDVHLAVDGDEQRKRVTREV